MSLSPSLVMITHVPALKLSSLFIGFYVLWECISYFVTLKILKLEDLGIYLCMSVFMCRSVCVCTCVNVCMHIYYISVYLLGLCLAAAPLPTLACSEVQLRASQSWSSRSRSKNPGIPINKR